VRVFDDPRMGDRTRQLIAQQAAYEDFYKLVKSASDGWERLQEGKGVVKLANDALVNAPDSLKRDVGRIGKSISDKIAELEKRYMMPDGLKGIQRNPDNLTGIMGQITRYIDSSDGPPSVTVRTLMEKSRSELSNILTDINKLFAEDVVKLIDKVRSSQTPMFKEYKPIEIK
jgi:hypothetical protein